MNQKAPRHLDNPEAAPASIGSQQTIEQGNWEFLQYLTKGQFAKRLQVSLRTVDNMIRRKQLPIIRIGRSVRIRVKAADEALLKYELKAIS